MPRWLVKPLPDSLTTFGRTALELVVGVVAAALNDEARNGAVEDRAGIIALVDELQELRHRERCALRVELDGEIARGGHDLHVRRAEPLSRAGRVPAFRRLGAGRERRGRRRRLQTISCFMPGFYSNGYNLEICPRPSSRVSHLRPPAPCIWGTYAPLCSATYGRETAAGDSFCASRTRMSSAARRVISRRSSRSCAGSGFEWDEGPEVGGPSAPYLQSERGAWYRELFARLESAGRAYPCYCTPDELELARKLERMAGRPPRYTGTCRALTAAERAARLARGTQAHAPFRRARRDGHRVHRSRARAAALLVGATSATSSFVARTARPRSSSATPWTIPSWASRMYCAATIISPTRRAS